MEKEVKIQPVKVKEIELTGSWSETASIGPYENVRPMTAIKAIVSGDGARDSEEIQRALLRMCKATVREAIQEERANANHKRSQ